MWITFCPDGRHFESSCVPDVRHIWITLFPWWLPYLYHLLPGWPPFLITFCPWWPPYLKHHVSLMATLLLWCPPFNALCIPAGPLTDNAVFLRAAILVIFGKTTHLYRYSIWLPDSMRGLTRYQGFPSLHSTPRTDWNTFITIQRKDCKILPAHCCQVPVDSRAS